MGEAREEERLAMGEVFLRDLLQMEEDLERRDQENINSTVKNAEFIFIVTPSQVVKQVLLEIKTSKITDKTILITCSKGIDESNLKSTLVLAI